MTDDWHRTIAPKGWFPHIALDKRPDILAPSRGYRVTPYQQMIQSIWAVLYYGDDPTWAYCVQRELYVTERGGSVEALWDKSDEAFTEATRANILRCEQLESERREVKHSLDTIIIAWESYAQQVLMPWLALCQYTQVWLRERAVWDDLPAFIEAVERLPDATVIMLADEVREAYHSPLMD